MKSNKDFMFYVLTRIEFWVFIAFFLFVAVYSISNAQPDIITDPIPQPPVIQTAQPATATSAPGVYPPNPTAIPFRPVSVQPTVDYRATLEAIGWNAP